MALGQPSLDSLFPTPSTPPSLSAPARWSGITPQTVEVLRKVLKDNHERWHIFFNDRGFHKYVYAFILSNLADNLVILSIAFWLCGPWEPTALLFRQVTTRTVLI